MLAGKWGKMPDILYSVQYNLVCGVLVVVQVYTVTYILFYISKIFLKALLFLLLG